MKQTIEKHSVNIQIGTMLTVIIAVVAGVWQTSLFMNQMQGDITKLDYTNSMQHKTLLSGYEHITDKIDENEKKIEVNRDTNSVIKIELATLKAILFRIEKAVTK